MTEWIKIPNLQMVSSLVHPLIGLIKMVVDYYYRHYYYVLEEERRRGIIDRIGHRAFNFQAEIEEG